MTRQVKTYNPNHVFVDTNVLIGAYSGDARYQTDSDCLHYLYTIVGKRLYISTLSLAQFVLARKQKCRVIITNNYKDYRLLLGAQIIKPSKVRTIAR